MLTPTVPRCILTSRWPPTRRRGKHARVVNGLPTNDQLDARLRQHLPQPGDWQPTSLRTAAVLCPLVHHAGQDHVVLVLRPADARQHPGQIAFPGGKREGWELPVETARRECREEIGVPEAEIDVLGSLGARESSSGLLVHAVLARVPWRPWRPDPREVVRVLTVPLADLLDEARWSERPPPATATGAQGRTSPHFVLGDQLLWGLTGRFVRDLLTVVRSLP